MRFSSGKWRRANSCAKGLSPAARTTAICRAPAACHCSMRCPMMVVFLHGNSSLGLPMREDAPAARMATPRVSFEQAATRSTVPYSVFSDFSNWDRAASLGARLDELGHDANGYLGDALGPDVQTNRAGDTGQLFLRRNFFFHKLAEN